MTRAVPAILLVFVAVACGGGEAEVPVSAAGIDVVATPVGTVDLSDPVRHEALDALDAILASDDGPEEPPAAPAAAPVGPSVPVPSRSPDPSGPPAEEVVPPAILLPHSRVVALVAC